MKLFTKLFCPAAAAAAFALAGCAGFNETDVVFNGVNDDSLIQISEDLKPELRLVKFYRNKTEAGDTTYRAMFRVRNDSFFGFVFSSYKEPQIAYRCVWYDAKGKEVFGDSSDSYKWHVVTARPGEIFGISTVSPDKKIQKFKLFIKPASQLTAADRNIHKGKSVGTPAKKNASTDKMMADKPKLPDNMEKINSSSLAPKNLTAEEKGKAAKAKAAPAAEKTVNNADK